jgi:putative membrane protein
VLFYLRHVDRGKRQTEFSQRDVLNSTDTKVAEEAMNVHLKSLGLLFVIATVVVGPVRVRADQDNKDLTALSDREFAAQAITIAKTQVKLSELAINQASDTKVTDFAKKMAKENAAMADQLTDASRALKIGLDYAREDEAKAAYSRIEALMGAEFDRTFIKAAIDNHVVLVALFEREAKSGENADIKTIAANSSQRLKDQLKEARTILDGLKEKR